MAGRMSANARLLTALVHANHFPRYSFRNTVVNLKLEFSRNFGKIHAMPSAAATLWRRNRVP